MTGWRDAATDFYTQAMADFRNASVAYRPAAGAAFTFEAVFDDAAAPVEVDGQVEISTSNPILAVFLSAMAVAPRQGDQCTITYLPSEQDPDPAPLGDYKVTDVLNDGQGGTRLPLQKL